MIQSRSKPWLWALSVVTAAPVALPSRPASANDQATLSQVSLFNRCYAHLTQKKPPRTHSLLAQVKAGSKTAVQACLEVLDSASLQASGANEGRLVTDGAEARMVLKTFYDFHRGWFPSDDFITGLPGEPIQTYLTGHLHDEQEPSLHVTRALLTSGVPYDAIVTGTEAMEALRSNGAASSGGTLKAKNVSGSFYDTGGSLVSLNTELVQTGELLGIRRMSLNSAKYNLSGYAGLIVAAGTSEARPVNLIYPHRTAGGGIIGTSSYMILNWGRPTYEASDGGISLPRRWSKAVLNDFLCRDLPAIRASDAQPLVQTTIRSTTPSFRGNASCMQCHGSTDSLAYAARNLYWTGMPGPYSAGNTVQMYQSPVTSPAETGVVDRDNSFHSRPPVGRLRFRSYDGTLVDAPVQGLGEIGAEIARQKDFYACAAARYFEFFTGVRVSLQDIGDPSAQALDPAEIAYRDLVIRLGNQLQSNKSLKQLIQTIISSDLYAKESMRLPAGN